MKHNYFVHGLIRLQVQQAYACIIELRLINTFLHAIPNSCMNGVTVVCACMHIIHTWRSKSLRIVTRIGGFIFASIFIINSFVGEANICGIVQKQAVFALQETIFVNNFHELDKQKTFLLCVAAPFRMQNNLNFDFDIFRYKYTGGA